MHSKREMKNLKSLNVHGPIVGRASCTFGILGWILCLLHMIKTVCFRFTSLLSDIQSMMNY